MDQCRDSEPNQHKGHKDDHDNDKPESCLVSVLQVRAVREYDSQEHAEVATENSTKPKESSLERYDSQALGGHSA
jgi:hypothetical protein